MEFYSGFRLNNSKANCSFIVFMVRNLLSVSLGGHGQSDKAGDRTRANEELRAHASNLLYIANLEVAVKTKASQ